MSKGKTLIGALSDREELNSILAGAVTVSRLAESDTLDDDLRMIRDVGARFLGRAAYAWLVPQDEEAHLRQAAELAARVHGEVDDTVVLQACLFEAVYPGVNRIPVPEHIFADLEQSAERRTFSFESMLGKVQPPAQGLGSPWQGGGVPDLAAEESLRWFYYRACRYIDAGYEALHLGQIHLVAGADREYRNTERLITAIRRYAAEHARRGWVLLDAHSHGIGRDGRLWLDSTSRPLSARALYSRPERIALVRRGTSLGGIHPGGWECDDAPVLLEVDNWHGLSLPQDPLIWLDGRARASVGRWGWDDISWFAHQSPEVRHEFLGYAEAWTRLQGPEWHFQIPLRRPLARGGLRGRDGRPILYYRANQRGPGCLDGFGDEAAITELRTKGGSRYPSIEPHQPAVSPSGLAIPEPVNLTGEIQEHIGGIPGDASCPWSRLSSVGGGIFTSRFAFPVAGDLRFTVTAGGTGIDPTNRGGISGGPAYALRVSRAGQIAEFRFDWEQRILEVRDVETWASLLIDPSEAMSAEEQRIREASLPWGSASDLPPDWF